MPPTPNGSASPYATVTQLESFKDWSQMADWLADGADVRGTKAQFEANPKVTVHLLASAGIIESACLKDNKYTAADLNALTGNSQGMLVMMNCWLCIMIMSQRKTRTKGDEAMITWAIDMIERLELGERIFALQEVGDAGISETVKTEAYGTPEYYNRVSVECGRFFGSTGRGWR